MSLHKIPQPLFDFMKAYEFTNCVYYAQIGSIAFGDETDLYELAGFTPDTDFYNHWREVEYIVLEAGLCSFEMENGIARKLNTTQHTFFFDEEPT